jgi:hypothetical protein
MGSKYLTPEQLERYLAIGSKTVKIDNSRFKRWKCRGCGKIMVGASRLKVCSWCDGDSAISLLEP